MENPICDFNIWTMGHTVLVQPLKLHVVSVIRFPGNLNEHDLACNCCDLFTKSVPL